MLRHLELIVKVLAFHKIEPGFSWGVTNCQPGRFAKIVEEIRDSESTEIALTFDDGYASFLDYADPVLRKFCLSATIFVLTGYIGEVNRWDYSARFKPSIHLNKSQIRELSERGYKIGSHTHSHRDLTRLPDDEISFELAESKNILEKILNKPVDEICYPFGRYNSGVEALAREAGYMRGWSMESGDRGPFTFGRMGVYAYDSPLSVKLKLDDSAAGSIERLKRRITNNLSRAGRFAFWTARPPAKPGKVEESSK